MREGTQEAARKGGRKSNPAAGTKEITKEGKAKLRGVVGSVVLASGASRGRILTGGEFERKG